MNRKTKSEKNVYLKYWAITELLKVKNNRNE